MPEKTQRVRMIYFEDLQEGVQPVSPEIVVDGKEMLEYNHKYDPWPLHVDEKAAKALHFDGIIASGGYTVSLAYLLSHKIYNTSESIWAFLGGIDSQLKFPAPVYAGDTLRYTLEVINKRFSNNPGRGIVSILEMLTNQNDDVVFTAETVILVATRPMVE
jgi:acyl dehydratase